MIAIGIAFAALLVLALQLAPGTGAPTEPPSFPAPPAEPPAPITGTTDTTAAATTPAMATTRTDVPPPSRSLPTAATWHSIRIVDEPTSQPVPGASVKWLDQETLYQTLIERRKDAALPPRRAIELIEELGWSTTSDADGIARVALPGSSTLCATADGRFGVLDVDPEALAPTAGHRLLLRRDRTLVLLVEDDQGRPCVDVPVSMGRRDQDGRLDSQMFSGPRGRTGADGTLRIPHLQTIVGPAKEPGRNQPESWFAFAWLPGAGPGTNFLVNDPPHPVRIRLPATGKIRVRVDAQGLALPRLEMTLCEKREADLERLLKSREATLDHDHTVCFDDVPVHGSYEVTFANEQLTVAGPSHRGDVVEATIALSGRRAVVIGKLVRANGAPTAATVVEVQKVGRLPMFVGSFDTEADGSFRWLIDIETVNHVELVMAPDRLHELHLDKVQPGAWRAHVAARAYEGPTIDLGDVVVEEEVPLVRGRIRHGEAPPPGAPEISIECESRLDMPEHIRWQINWSARAECQPNGEFVVHGLPADTRHRVCVRVAGMQTVEPVEFEPGATDVEIQLQAGHVLAASVLFPTGAPCDQLLARLVPTTDLQRTEAMDARFGAPTEDQASLHWHGLPAGTYTLELQLAPGVLLHQLTGVNVPPPVGGDARLVAIDLRPAVRVVTIELLGTDDRPVGDYGGLLVSPRGPEPHHAYQLDGAATKILLPADCAQLVAHVQGHRPHSFAVSGDHVVLRLTPWRTIDLRIPSAEALPDSMALVVELRPLAPATRRYRARWYDDTAKELDDHTPFQSQRAVNKGQVTLPIGDDAYHVQLTLMQEDGRSTTVLCTMPSPIRWQAKPLVLDVSADDWQRLREQ